MFIHLHAHSNFSLLESLPAPRELAQAAARLDMPALALTDHSRLSGAIEFYTACQENGVKPILGLEINVNIHTPESGGLQLSGSPLVLLAQDFLGWSGLCRLASAAQMDPSSPEVAADLLAEYSPSLLCLSGGEHGPVDRLIIERRPELAAQVLSRLHELFPDRLYVELQLHAASGQERVERLADIARSLDLPLIATHGIYYLGPDQETLQRTLTAIRLNRPLQQIRNEELAPPGAWFISPQELSARFAAFPQALEATREVAERCQLELPLGIPHFPQVELSPGTSPIQVLRQKAQQGATDRFGANPAVQLRLDHELDVIEKCGYEALFLVMEEIVGFARQSGIPIASRGSASSSLVAHCLGITTPDPVRLNLYFERFLNPARQIPPDIDTDICSRRREEVIRFVYERFGAERVAMVCIVNRFRRRSALRETAKAHGLSPVQVNELADSLPQRWYDPPGRFSGDEQPYSALEAHFHSPVYQELFKQAAALIGLPRHLSIHPGGVVISPGSMTDLTPTQMAAKGILITQLDLEAIERLGLVKIDLLGIRGLTVMGDVAEAIVSQDLEQTSLAAEISPSPIQTTRTVLEQARAGLNRLEAIPDLDPATADTVEQGRTIGCFQIESPGMRATLKEIHARTTDDLMAALALYRPGPLTGGLKDAFVARYRGQQPTAFLHPSLERLLGDTFGVILYQEQVLRIAHELAGFSLVEADLLRRGMSHFDPGKQMTVLRERFITRAAERSGVPLEIGVQIWEQMAAFAGYGFPKAHAASYARLAWQSAWCKTHFPALFMAAVLANWGGYYSQRVYLTEARRMGLFLSPPNINYARSEFSVTPLADRRTLFMGLNQVRDLTRKTQSRILKNRPFHSLADFLAKVDPRPVEAKNLIRVGALDGFGTIPSLLDQIQRGGWRSGQLPLFDWAVTGQEDWSLAEKAAAQEEVLGISLVAHPLELVAGQIAAAGALTTVEVAARLGERVRVAGVRQTWRRHQSASGDTLYIMALEDLDGTLNVLIPGEVYRRSRQAFSRAGPYILEGVVDWDPERGEPLFRAERAWAVDDFQPHKRNKS